MQPVGGWKCCIQGIAALALADRKQFHARRKSRGCRCRFKLINPRLKGFQLRLQRRKLVSLRAGGKHAERCTTEKRLTEPLQVRHFYLPSLELSCPQFRYGLEVVRNRRCTL